MRIALLLVAGLVSMVLALSRGPDEESHEAILNALRSIDLTFAALQRDVLQARSGILKNYDFLGLAIDQMRDDLKEIASVSRTVSLAEPEMLEEKLTVVAQSIDHNEAMIERFKSGNAMIQNSLRIFGQTLGEMRVQSKAEQVEFFLEAQGLGQQMWQFQNGQNLASGEDLKRGLVRLRGLAQPDIAPLTGSLVEHGLLIVKTLPAVDSIVSGIQSLERVRGSLELQREYFQQFGHINARMSLIRVVLALISLSLCAYATYLAVRLKLYADSLHWKLYVEQTVNEAVTRISLEPERFQAVMNEALSKMKEVFGFESVCLLDLDPSDWSERSVFGRSDLPEVCTSLVGDVISDLRDTAKLERDRVLWRHPVRYRNLGSILDALRTPKPLAVASYVRPHKDMVVIMVARCQAAYWNMRTDEQVLRMTTELLALALEKQQRLADLDELDRRVEEGQRLEAVGTLAGGVAHEFNNILMAIMGYAEMAATALEISLPARRYVDHVLSAGARAKLVVDQMLTFGRMRRNPMLPFDAVRATQEMLPVIEVCLPSRVKLHVDLPDCPAAMNGSAIEIQQVLVNLCKNAGEAIAGEGHVKLAIDSLEVSVPYKLTHGDLQPGPHLRIAVTDTGPGIAPAQLQRIFEPFFTTKGDGGTGLGLSVVHGTVQSLKGAMHVSSIVSRGTRFELYFPLLDPKVLPTHVPIIINSGERDVVTPGRGELIAVVDSRESSRLMWEEKIAALGYEPVGFQTAAQLAKWCSTNVADAVLMVINYHATEEVGDLLGLPAVYMTDGSYRLAPVPSTPYRVLNHRSSIRNLQDALRSVLEDRDNPRLTQIPALQTVYG